MNVVSQFCLQSMDMATQMPRHTHWSIPIQIFKMKEMLIYGVGGKCITFNLPGLYTHLICAFKMIDVLPPHRISAFV